MANISQYKSGVTGGSVPILGYLVFYTVTGERVPHAEAVKALANDGYTHIGKDFPPAPPKDVDVFKRIASQAKRSRVETDKDDVFKNVLIRDVGSMNNTVTKRIVVEYVTRKNKKLDFVQPKDVEFNQNSGVVVDRDRPGVPSEDIADDIAAWIKSEYYAWRGCLNSYAVREWIRAEIRRLNASVIKKGVYFVSADREDALLELTRFVGNLPGDSMFHTLPLVDNTKQRDMLKVAYESEAQKEIDELMADIGDAIATGRKTTTKGYETKLRSYVHLTQKMQDYKALLNDNLSLASARMDLLDEMMDEFSDTLTTSSEQDSH